MTARALRLSGITKSYAGRRVLDGITLDVQMGSIVALLGPNGAGKSTLLRIAANLTSCDQGTVHLHGALVPHDAPAARRDVAYVGQDAALYDELTPAEHVVFWARLHDGAIDANRILAEAGLAAAAHKATGTLSRGQRQRLALALALAAAPGKSLLVLDEPFTGLDAAAHDGLERTLRDRRAEGAALLVALHDEAQARRLADRLVRLEHHRLHEVPA